MSTSDEDLKERYLRQAHHLIQRDTRGSKRKLKASIEPISNEGRLNKSERGGGDVGHSLSYRSSFTKPFQTDHSSISCSQSTTRVLGTPHGSNHSFQTPHSTPIQRHNHSLPDPTDPSITADSTAELESQLQTQREVNKELKRLLVASVGSDLELRLEQIVREKAELSQDLSLSLRQVLNHHEELDQVSIECDIWRSKFIASRVMIDELASWKAELSLRLRESQKALQYILHEREDITHEMLECHNHLQRARNELKSRPQHRTANHLGAANVATVSPIQYGTSGSLAEEESSLTVLELARGNTVAVKNLTGQLYRGNQSENTALSGQTTIKPTTGERLAHRVMSFRGSLQRDAATEAGSPSLPKFFISDEDLVHRRSPMTGGMGGSSSLSPLSRRLFHYGAKALEDPFRLPFHCAKCQGKIIVV